jgi:RNA polymerase sigma factor (sigma-70 family)
MQAGAEPDVALIDASCRGDRTAFARIVERYQRTVYAVAFSKVRDRVLTDDITQDTFVTAWSQLSDLRDATRLPAWLCGIARNLARDACKRRRRDHASDVQDVAGGTTPFEALSEADSERVIAAALAKVPDAYREPLVLFYYEQQSVEQVARTLGITAHTTNKRLSRGRRYLADGVTRLVESGLARRGPKSDLVAGVLLAIGVLGSASHVDASPPAAKGSTMLSKLTIAAILTTVVVGGVGLLSAETTRNSTSSSPRATTTTTTTAPVASAPRKPAPAAPAPASPSRVSAPPKLPASSSAPVVPDCDAAARHMAELSLQQFGDKPIPAAKRTAFGESIASSVSASCKADHWSENRRLCVVDADSYKRARIDCTDEPGATADEVASLPAELRCPALAQHVYELANGPDGKFAKLKQRFAADPDRIATIDKLSLKARDAMADECEQQPWRIERRRCLVAATTHRAVADCM